MRFVHLGVLVAFELGKYQPYIADGNKGGGWETNKGSLYCSSQAHAQSH